MMHRIMPKLFTYLLLASALIWLAGCGDKGPKRYHVTGSVTFEGKPIEAGEIRFSPFTGQGRPDSGKILDGKYELKVTAGKKKIKIFAASTDPELVGPPPSDMPPGGFNPPRDFIPSKYNVDSELSVEVEPASNQTFPFELVR